MTSYETLYSTFFNFIEKDKMFFSYNNVEVDEALKLAKSRAKNYLFEAIGILKMKCKLDVDIQLNDESESISVDLTDNEILLIASLMYERYLFRDVALLKSATNALTSSQIKMLFSPANDRKTFIDLYKTIQDENRVLIDNYNSRDRITGERKTINYSQYGI